MFFKLSTKLIYFILINYQIVVVYSQNDLNNPQTYTSLIILLFFLFTIFGILTAFLIKHKPRRRHVSLSRGAKDLENSKEIAFSEYDNQNDYFDINESNKPIIYFDEPKNTFNNEINKNPDLIIKQKLMNDYLNQTSSDLEFRSPDSLSELNKEFRQSLGLGEDELSLHSRDNQEFKEIPKNLIIANTELINNENNSLQNEFDKKNVEHDTFSNTYKISIDEEKSDHDIKLDNDTQTEPFELKEDNFKNINKFENDDREQKTDNLLKEIVDIKNNLLNEYDKNELNEKSIDESETYAKNKKDIENRLKKMDEIPESSTFPNISDHESIKSAKSYHSYGFPLEDDNQLALTSSKFLEPDQNLQNSVRRWNSLYNNSVEKPSDYDEMMRNLNQRMDMSVDKVKQNDEIKESKKLDEKSEISSKSTESSAKYEYKVIVCPPLDAKDPNAKYLENNTNKNEFPSTEETDPSKLINDSLNESENSCTNPQLDELNQQVKNVLESKLKEINSLKPINKMDESSILKTLNSVDSSFTDYSISKDLSNTQTTLSSNLNERNNSQTPKNKSVLDVLEKRLK